MRQILWLVVFVVVLGGCQRVADRYGEKAVPEQTVSVKAQEKSSAFSGRGFSIDVFKSESGSEYKYWAVVDFHTDWCSEDYEYDCTPVLKNAIEELSQGYVIHEAVPIQGIAGNLQASYTAGMMCRVSPK